MIYKIEKLYRIFILKLCIVFILSCKSNSINEISQIQSFPYKSYHLDDSGDILNTEIFSSDFQDSKDCAECHPNHYEEWNMSSHAHSSSSIFFQKRLADAVHEHEQSIERFCDQCHDPISVISEKDENNSLIHSGVTCDVCHTMTRKSSTTIALPHQIVTSQLFLNPGEGIKYGPLNSPNQNNYHESQFNPIYKQSESCLPCHDLKHENLETEITFTEWSRIPGMSMSGAFPCQQCHMPEKEDGTHEHHFAGVDLSYELPPKEEPLYNKVLELLETAAQISFKSNIEEIADSIAWSNYINIPVRIESLNGHHLPSGTSFNRECWVSIEVRDSDANGELIYKNGILESTIELLNYYEKDLVLFTSFLITEEGDTTQDVLKASQIINHSLPGLNIKYTDYRFKINNQIKSLWIKAKLNFRPIKPFIFDELPLLKQNIPIYTIDEIEKTIHIIN